MNIELLSRIEDQLLEKFDRVFTKVPKSGAIDREEMFQILVDWMDFWLSEKIISKFPNPVVDMKNHICDIRIGFIMDKARKCKMDEALQAYFEARWI